MAGKLDLFAWLGRWIGLPLRIAARNPRTATVATLIFMALRAAVQRLRRRNSTKMGGKRVLITGGGRSHATHR